MRNVIDPSALAFWLVAFFKERWLFACIALSISASRKSSTVRFGPAPLLKMLFTGCILFAMRLTETEFCSYFSWKENVSDFSNKQISLLGIWYFGEIRSSPSCSWDGNVSSFGTILSGICSTLARSLTSHWSWDSFWGFWISKTFWGGAYHAAACPKTATS